MRISKAIKAMAWPEPYKGEDVKVNLRITVAQPVENGHRLLVVTFARNTKKRRNTWEYKGPFGGNIRLVCCKATGEVAILEQGGKASSTRSLEKALESIGAGMFSNPDIDERDEAILARWLGAKETRNHYLPELNVWVNDALEAQREARKVAQGELSDEDVYLCPEDIPEGTLEYIRQTVLPEDHVLVYKKGNVRGTCYRCGAKVKAPPGVRFKQHETAICPNCGQPVECVLEDSIAFHADYVESVATLQVGKDGATVFVRQWKLCRPTDPADLVEKTASCLREVARYAVRGNKAAKWQHEVKERWGWSSMSMVRRSWIDRWQRMGNTSEIYDGGYFFHLPADWKDQVATTSLRYIDLGGYCEGDALAGKNKNPIRFILDWGRYHEIELLWKAGYVNLVNAKVTRADGETTRTIHWSKHSIQEAMPFPFRLLKQAAPADWNVDMVKKTRKLWGMVQAGKIAEREMADLAVCKVNIEHIKTALDHAAARKVVKYINAIYDAKERERQALKEAHKAEPYYYALNNSAGQTYRDYLADCVKLELDLDDQQVLFPPDLDAAHARTITQVKYQENNVYREAFHKVAAKLVKMSMAKDGLLIRPAADPDELTAEGAYLHHCVGGYVDDMAEGLTTIFLIRRVEAPDTPFFTLELNHGQLIQCRTTHNRSYESDPAVMAFVQEWMETVVAKKNKKTKAKKAA